MAEEAGIVYLEAGINQQNRRELASTTHEQLNNAQGSSGTYINGVGKPDNTEVLLPVPYRTFKDAAKGAIAAHRGPGELFYLALDAQAVDQLDTSTFASVEFHEEIVNVQTGMKRQVTHQLADRVTDTTQGGVADDPFTVVGQKVPMLAFRALGPNEYGRLWGFCRTVTGDQ